MRDVGVELKELLDGWKKGKFPLKSSYQRLLDFLTAPSLEIKEQRLQPAVSALQSSVRRFAISVVKLLKEYRVEVVEKQLALDRIATGAIALYTAAAVLKKLEFALKNDTAGKEEEMVRGLYYCHIAMRRLNCALKDLFGKEDSIVEEAADGLLAFPTPSGV